MQENKSPADLREDIIIGRNAVFELLNAGRPVECIFTQKGLTGSILKIAAIAREKGIVVKDVAIQKLDAMCGKANHQGVIAQVSAARYSEMEDIFARAESAGEPLFVIIADEIEDPHNLGAIIRTAEAAGAHGLIIPKRRSAGLSFIVGKASAGAIEHLPVVRVGNLASTIDSLKKMGVFIYAADMDGQNYAATDYSGPVALVLGSEGEGVGKLIKQKCDFIVSMPMRGKISSLNVSVAAGIICYEIARQRLRIEAFKPANTK